MKNFLFLLGLLFPCVLFAQTIRGKVTNDKNEPLIGANVYWANSTIGTTTGTTGEYELSSASRMGHALVARYIGYTSDTIRFNNQNSIHFKLKPKGTLDEVVVKEEQQAGVIISDIEAIKVEQLTETELGKAACCDLAGCFETQTTVQAQTTNVITNSKELRILGLSGVYNQVLIDGFPMIQGLTYTYGISSIPGTLVKNIFISKGANSVLQGFESISGQINVITKDPSSTDKLFLNVYANSFAEKQFNANFALKSGKWSNLTTVQTVQPAGKFDRDHDNFLDLPKLTRYLIYNKLKYGDERDWGWSSKLGIRFMNEKRVGGQTDYDENMHKGSDQVYGQTVNINQPEIWTKTNYRMNDQHNFVLFVSSFYHNQNSYFGTVKYDAKQINVYTNLQYEYSYKKNTFKTGLSFRHLNLDETVSFTQNLLQRTYAGHYLKNENIAGIFAENTVKLLQDRLTWIAGIRLDQHNQFGVRLTPRTLLKYDVSANTVVRANIGTGWRTVNLFSENIMLLISSRDIVFAEQLRPEQALNSGINITHKFKGKRFTGYITADFYRTDFQNQIFPDYDSDPTKAIIENFKGKSVSNTFQTEVALTYLKEFQIKIGYGFLDVYREIQGNKVLLPFNSRNRIVTSLGYAPESKKYQIDLHAHLYGKKRLPKTKYNPEEFQRPDFSERFAVVNAQFTYNLKRFEIYLGCENMFDFRQLKPILGWQDPFGQYFDTSSVWGPTRGREFYLGLRFRLARK